MTVSLLDDEGFQKFVEDHEVVLVDLWAEWCGPCRSIAPVIDELSEVYAGKVAFGKLNIDENKRIPSKYGVMSIPTLLIFKDGELADRIVGFIPKDRIASKLEKYL